MDSNSLPLNNLNPAQRKAFNEHLNDLWDDYQDELADLIIEAKTMVPNSLYFGDDSTTEARRQLEDYARKANLIAQDYYRNVRAAWAEAAGIGMPDYTEAQVSSDRAFWQIVGGYNNTMHVGAKFTDVINGRSKAGLTMDYLWAVNTQGYTEDDWARLAKDIINETARLTGRLTAQNDPTKPKYARVPQGKTCAFCAMLASRGFVYASEDTAGKWHKYHHDCDCKIVPSWGETEIDGYDPDKLKAIYQQAKDAAKAAGAGSDLNTVLSWMRSESPESFTDGSEFSPDLRIPRGSRLEQQLGEAYTRRVNRLLSKTEHKDAARLWAKYAAQYDIKETRLSKGAYFSPSDGGIYLNLDTVMAGDSAHRPVQNLFHESGHMLDWLLDRNMYSSGPHHGTMFADTLNKDAQNLYNSTQAMLMADGKPSDRQHVLWELGQQVRRGTAKTDRNIEDMLQAALGDDYPKTVGHPNGYFQQQGSHQSSEAFAEMLDAQLANPAAWAIIENFMPESAKMFNTMIREATP